MEPQASALSDWFDHVGDPLTVRALAEDVLGKCFLAGLCFTLAGTAGA